MNFNFYVGTNIHFGESCFNDLLAIIEQSYFKKIGIVVDHNLMNLSITSDLIDNIKKIVNVIVENVQISEPTYEYLESIRRPFMDSGIEAVIGVGGGSTIDVSKAVAVLVNNKQDAIQYRGFNKMTEPVLPVIAIPTTAGTGSEVTPNASFVDEGAKKKLGINGDAIRPHHAFLNPNMLISCPKSAAISAGLDALVHAVEAFSSINASYVSKVFSIKAVGLILKNLEKAIHEKEIQAMECVFLGSLMAGIALMNSGAGPAAALSYPLGVHKKVPHGIAGGVFLPRIMEWNFRHKYYGYSELAEYIFKKRISTTKKQASKLVIDKFNALWQSLKVPSDLVEFGFEDDDIELFVSDVLELMGALEQNPIKFGEKEVKDILKDCL